MLRGAQLRLPPATFLLLLILAAANVGFALPDLVVVSISVSPDPPVVGYDAILNVTIKNNGLDPVSTDFEGQFTVDGQPWGQPIHFGQGLQPGASTTGETTWTPQQTGPYTIGFAVDTKQQVAEADESAKSNYRQSDVTVAESNPDLTVTDITWTPDPPRRNRSVTVRATVRNDGYRAAVGDWWGQFYFDGIPLGLLRVSGPISVSESVQVETTWIPTSSKTYTVVFSADVFDDIAEMREDNNQRSENLYVEEPPHTSRSIDRGHRMGPTIPAKRIVRKHQYHNQECWQRHCLLPLSPLPGGAERVFGKRHVRR